LHQLVGVSDAGVYIFERYLGEIVIANNFLRLNSRGKQIQYLPHHYSMAPYAGFPMAYIGIYRNMFKQILHNRTFNFKNNIYFCQSQAVADIYFSGSFSYSIQTGYLRGEAASPLGEDKLEKMVAVFIIDPIIPFSNLAGHLGEVKIMMTGSTVNVSSAVAGRHIAGGLFLGSKNLFWLLRAIELTHELLDSQPGESDENRTDEWYEAITGAQGYTAAYYVPENSFAWKISLDEEAGLRLREIELSEEIGRIVLLLKLYKEKNTKVQDILAWLQENKEGLIKHIFLITQPGAIVINKDFISHEGLRTQAGRDELRMWLAHEYFHKTIDQLPPKQKAGLEKSFGMSLNSKSFLSTMAKMGTLGGPYGSISSSDWDEVINSFTFFPYICEKLEAKRISWVNGRDNGLNWKDNKLTYFLRGKAGKRRIKNMKAPFTRLFFKQVYAHALQKANEGLLAIWLDSEHSIEANGLFNEKYQAYVIPENLVRVFIAGGATQGQDWIIFEGNVVITENTLRKIESGSRNVLSGIRRQQLSIEWDLYHPFKKPTKDQLILRDLYIEFSGLIETHGAQLTLELAKEHWESVVSALLVRYYAVEGVLSTKNPAVVRGNGYLKGVLAVILNYMEKGEHNLILEYLKISNTLFEVLGVISKDAFEEITELKPFLNHKKGIWRFARFWVEWKKYSFTLSALSQEEGDAAAPRNPPARFTKKPGAGEAGSPLEEKFQSRQDGLSQRYQEELRTKFRGNILGIAETGKYPLDKADSVILIRGVSAFKIKDNNDILKRWELFIENKLIEKEDVFAMKAGEAGKFNLLGFLERVQRNIELLEASGAEHSRAVRVLSKGYSYEYIKNMAAHPSLSIKERVYYLSKESDLTFDEDGGLVLEGKIAARRRIVEDFDKFGQRRGRLYPEEIRYKEWAVQGLKPAGNFSHEESELLANALVRMQEGTLNYLVMDGILTEGQKSRVINLKEFIIDGFAVKIREEERVYQGNNFSNGQIKRALFSKLFTFRRAKIFLDAGFSRRDISMIVPHHRDPLEWLKAVKPLRDKLVAGEVSMKNANVRVIGWASLPARDKKFNDACKIVSAVSPGDLLEIVNSFANLKEWWNVAGGFRDQLVAQGVSKRNANRIIIKHASLCQKWWEEVKDIADRILSLNPRLKLNSIVTKFLEINRERLSGKDFNVDDELFTIVVALLKLRNNRDTCPADFQDKKPNITSGRPRTSNISHYGFERLCEGLIKYPSRVGKLEILLKNSSERTVFNNALVGHIQSLRNVADKYKHYMLLLWNLNLKFSSNIAYSCRISLDSYQLGYPILQRCVEKFNSGRKDADFLSYYRRALERALITLRKKNMAERQRFVAAPKADEEELSILDIADFQSYNRDKRSDGECQDISDSIRVLFEQWWASARLGVEALLGQKHSMYEEADIIKIVREAYIKIEAFRCPAKQRNMINWQKLKEEYPEMQRYYKASNVFLQPFFCFFFTYLKFREGYNQSEIARELKITRESVSRYFRSQIMPAILSKKMQLSLTQARKALKQQQAEKKGKKLKLNNIKESRKRLLDEYSQFIISLGQGEVTAVPSEGLECRTTEAGYFCFLHYQCMLNLSNHRYCLRIIGSSTTQTEKFFIAQFESLERANHVEYKKIKLLADSRISYRWGSVKLDYQKGEGVFSEWNLKNNSVVFLLSANRAVENKPDNSLKAGENGSLPARLAAKPRADEAGSPLIVYGCCVRTGMTASQQGKYAAFQNIGGLGIWYREKSIGSGYYGFGVLEQQKVKVFNVMRALCRGPP